MENHLKQLSDNEFEIIKLLEQFNYSLETGDQHKIEKQYYSIHGEYTHTQSIEGLKRAIFIQWYALTEPSYLSGIGELNRDNTIKNIKTLNDLILSDQLDNEFMMMLDYYYRIADWYFDAFENEINLKAFFRRSQITTSEKIDCLNRGQMGLYWCSLNF